jgi:hypothetical protein
LNFKLTIPFLHSSAALPVSAKFSINNLVLLPGILSLSSPAYLTRIGWNYPRVSAALFLSLPKQDWIAKLVPSVPRGAVEFVPVTDFALLHVGALILPGLSNERLVASPHPVSWNEILAIFRKNFPHKKFYDDIPSLGSSSNESCYDSTSGLEVLKKTGKETGWTPLEQMVLETVTPFA